MYSIVATKLECRVEVTMGYLVEKLTKEFDEYMTKVASERYDPIEVSTERAIRQVEIKKATMMEANFRVIQEDVFSKFEADAVIRNLNAEAQLQKERNKIAQERNDLKTLWADKEAHDYDSSYEPKIEEVDNTTPIEVAP